MEPIDIFLGCGVEVILKESDDFLKVRESLTRIGVASRIDNILYQSCHILHKRGRYSIVHFKELYKLDGRPTDISENDLSRRNTIAMLLSDWGLVILVNEDDILDPPPIHISQIKIIKHKDKNEWELAPKYSIGSRVKNYDEE